MEPVDVRANHIGKRQFGRVTRAQLYGDAGIAPSTVAARLRSGAWREPLPKVVDLGTHAPSWRGRVLEVLLAAGPEAWASHDTAAHLLGFLDAPRPASVDALVLRGRHAKVAELRLHTTRSLGADEVTERHGLACTSGPRTVLDLAAATAPATIERWILDQERRSPGFVARLVALTDRHRTIPGRRRVLDVVGRLPGDVARLGSPLEVIGVQRLVQLGAPPFVLQYQVCDLDGAPIKRTDAAWPDERTLLEFDGGAYHDLSGARAHDEEVRARMRALGWRLEVMTRADIDGPRLEGLVRHLSAIHR
ncbi:hypothetical protein [Nitriliruptor alkaliphilus]|uniref:hypothetical protein n=1 Tax=Nitriliruptor alkaliphilus TaxID=427918 RepID=UPI000697A5AB|nr:hypothetical protein [Nitriliruptor alkaliphilus]